jgi:XisI protein
MDKINHYYQIIQDILTANGQVKLAYGDVEMEILFDRAYDRYQEKECGNFPSQCLLSTLPNSFDATIWHSSIPEKDSVEGDFSQIGSL